MYMWRRTRFEDYVPRKSGIRVSLHEKWKSLKICFHLKKPTWPSKNSKRLNKLTKRGKRFILDPLWCNYDRWSWRPTNTNWRIQRIVVGSRKPPSLLSLGKKKGKRFLEIWNLFEKAAEFFSRAFEICSLNSFVTLSKPLYQLSCSRKAEWGNLFLSDLSLGKKRNHVRLDWTHQLKAQFCF